MIWTGFLVILQLLVVLAQVPTKTPKKPPSARPKKRPTKTPVNPGSPSKKPSKTTKVPTDASLTSIARVLLKAKIQISAMIEDNPPIAATILRLIFHDCVPNGDAGGCDGCVNLSSNAANNGLQPAVQSLAPIVAAFENKSLGISRADLWSFAALVSAERSQSTLDFTDKFRVGRKNCETVGTCSSNDPKFCASNGPDQSSDFPSTNLSTHGLLRFMSDHFGYNADQTVAIMGAHSIGRALPKNAGFQGSWDNSNRVLDNDFYRAIVGSPDPVQAPKWVQIPVGKRFQWARPGTQNTVMLNVDMAIVRDLEEELGKSGVVECSFRSTNRCPLADTLTKASEYRNDNDVWLADFKEALKIMVEKGLV